MFVNLELMNSRIKEKKLKLQIIAGKLNIGRNTLFRKLSGSSSWKVEEIFKMAEILELPVSTLFKLTTNYDFCAIPKHTLLAWQDLLLDGNSKEVIKKLSEVIYGNI